MVVQGDAGRPDLCLVSILAVASCHPRSGPLLYNPGICDHLHGGAFPAHRQGLLALAAQVPGPAVYCRDILCGSTSSIRRRSSVGSPRRSPLIRYGLKRPISFSGSCSGWRTSPRSTWNAPRRPGASGSRTLLASPPSGLGRGGGRPGCIAEEGLSPAGSYPGRSTRARSGDGVRQADHAAPGGGGCRDDRAGVGGADEARARRCGLGGAGPAGLGGEAGEEGRLSRWR